jgi:hypothetical protein
MSRADPFGLPATRWVAPMAIVIGVPKAQEV